MSVSIIIDGVMTYPEIFKLYTDESVSIDFKYTIDIDYNAPLPDDEEEEKASDLIEVQAEVMSKKSYMKKWRGLTDSEIEEELKQIALEKNMSEDIPFE